MPPQASKLDPVGLLTALRAKVPHASCQITLKRYERNFIKPLQTVAAADPQLADLLSRLQLEIDKALPGLPPENPNLVSKPKVVTNVSYGEIKPYDEYEVAGASDIGTKHLNDNTIGASLTPDGLLIQAADGLGGHADGNCASLVAVKTVRRDEHKGLLSAVQSANEAINKLSGSKTGLDRMGTTIAAVKIKPAENLAVIANVGDVRVYRLRKDGTITLLSTPHINIIPELPRIIRSKTFDIIYKDLSNEQKNKVKGELDTLLFPMPPFYQMQIELLNDLLRRIRVNLKHLNLDLHQPQFALGLEASVTHVSIIEERLEPGDIILAATGGLSLSPDEIRKIFGLGLSFEAAVKQLVADSKIKNGKTSTNISVVGYRHPEPPLEEKTEAVEPKPEVSTVAFLQSAEVAVEVRAQRLLDVLAAGGEDKTDVIEAIGENGILLRDLPATTIEAAFDLICRAVEVDEETRLKAVNNLRTLLPARSGHEPTPEFVVLPAKPGEAINQLLAIQKEAFDDEKPASLDRLLEL
ncbi:MAG: protein phosphatase 2C domain-containing protein, partial [Candidatus Margulisbacteria bacterium]|nr:protein phosphatase 2C domain-containing protein [Candidatus Margulisiibacteriota bacterium]